MLSSVLQQAIQEAGLFSWYEQTPNTMYRALPTVPFDTIKANEHDGRSLTLADTVEYFNLVLGLKMTQEEKGFARGMLTL